jgi:TRAP transporter TAXI family solute receptor
LRRILMKRKKLLILVSTICLALILVALPLVAACGEEVTPPAEEEEEEVTPPAEEEEAWAWPESLTVLTCGIGGAIYVTAAGWVPVLEHETGMKVRLVPEDSTAAKARWMKAAAGEYMLMPVGRDDTCMDITQGLYEEATREGGPFDIRSVYMHAAFNFGFAVRGDSGIETIFDIKPGMSLAEIPAIPNLSAGTHALVNALGIDEEDMTWVPFGGVSDFYKAAAEGKVDISYVNPVSAATYEAESIAAAHGGLVWLDITSIKEDPEMMERFREKRALAAIAPCVAGLESGIGVPMVVSYHYIFAAAELDPEFVYQFIKWMDENHDLYKDKSDQCKFMTIDNFAGGIDSTWTPLHEGAIRYLKEKGLWTEAYQARQDYLVDLQQQYIDAYAAALKKADEMKIVVAYDNPEWVELWESYKEALPQIGVEPS